jgi:hypothetical protein
VTMLWHIHLYSSCSESSPLRCRCRR